MKLSARIKSIRTDWKLNQADMAKKLGIATSTYQYYERGERDVPSSILVSLTTFGVNSEWLLTGKHQEYRQNTDVAEMSSELIAADNDDLGESPELVKAVELLAKIFASGERVLIRAITDNLHAFAETVDSHQREKAALEMIAELKERVERLEMENASIRRVLAGGNNPEKGTGTLGE